MANKKIQSIGSEISIPSDLEEFKYRPQVVWTGSSWRDKEAFYTTDGYISEFQHDGSISPGSGSGNLYTANEADGIDFLIKSNNSQHGNTETIGDSRWMPATIFNGCGFEVHQSHGNVNSMYLQKWCLAFSHRHDNTFHRTWGVNTNATAPYAGYRYIKLPDSDISGIRNMGKDWLLQGLIFNYRTNFGFGTDINSGLRIYNLRVGHKFSDVNNNYRYIPCKRRSYTDRNIVNAGFTDPFS